MDKLKEFLTIISGYKTYIAGTISIGIGIWQNNMELIMLGLVAMGLRSAIN